MGRVSSLFLVFLLVSCGQSQSGEIPGLNGELSDLQQASLFESRGELNSALILYQTSFETDSNLTALQGSVRVYESASLPLKALSVWSNAQSRTNENDFLLKSARLLYKAGLYEETLSAAKNLSETNREFLLIFAKAHRELENFEDSMALFEEMFSVETNFWEYYHYGKLFARMEDFEKAVEIFFSATNLTESLENRELCLNQAGKSLLNLAFLKHENGEILGAKTTLLKIPPESERSYEKAEEYLKIW